jgi:3-hydroxyacyl-CoA dehydrogenase/enoyl-CoA hydratase/3-hydroxybutyryl-CoA epimerase
MFFESDHLRIAAESGIATLRIAGAGRTGDRLTGAVLAQIGQALRVVRATPGLDVLALRGSWAGLDPDELAGFQGEPDWVGLAALGQGVCRRLALLSRTVPTVAVIEGPCRGAGLELALACDCRIAVARPDTLLALDQVSLRLTPCWGGTWRLPRLTGLRAALPMLLDGRELSARQAVTGGLVDHAFCERVALTEVWGFLRRVRAGWRPRRRWRFRDRLPFAGWRLLRRVGDAGEGRRAVLRAVAAGWTGTPAEAEAEERRAVANLGMTPACQELIRLARRAVLPPGRPPAGRCLTVVGSGELAAVLATRAVLAGVPVNLPAQDGRARDEVLKRVERLLDEARRRGLQTPLEAANRLRMIGQAADAAGPVVVTGEGGPVPGAVRLRQLAPAGEARVAEVVCPDDETAAEAERWFAALGLLTARVGDGAPVYGAVATAGASEGTAAA